MAEPFQSISDVSKALGVPAHTLRYWEKTFPVAIKPVTGTGGRRYYRADTVATLKRVRELLYENGYTIAGVKKLLAYGSLDVVADIPAVTPVPMGVIKAPSTPVASPVMDISSAELDRAIDLLSRAARALN